MHQALAIAGLSLILTACQAGTAAFLPGSTSSPAAGVESPFVQETATPTPSFPAGRVATRVVVARLGIDLPIMLQTAKYGTFPLCDVALYLPQLGQPGQGRATYIYAHARDGMFGPLLAASLVNNGQAMIGDIAQIYTSDDYLFTYKIVEVDRHILDLNDALAAHTEELFLQTSEGPHGHVPKLEVIATFVSAEPTDPAAAHPTAHPRICT